VLLPVLLFVATCISTWFAGAAGLAAVAVLEYPSEVISYALSNWRDGALYMASVMGILLAHEMGHFVLTLRHRIHASLPFFIPMPISPLGTMGAVIAMHAYMANRKQLFDIGLAGPLAGLVVALPVTWYGILQADAVTAADLAQARAAQSPLPTTFQDPLVVEVMIRYLRPEVTTGELVMNPFLMAGWVGFLITGLNMFPISQLDGGHISYALFGKGAHLIARLVVIGALLFFFLSESYMWAPMLVLLMFLGIKHPPTADDTVELGWPRRIIGLASLSIPILCFPPWGMY
jgi:membrane-associated protease RseP (regulator of RpoE activity)